MTRIRKTHTRQLLDCKIALASVRRQVTRHPTGATIIARCRNSEVIDSAVSVSTASNAPSPCTAHTFLMSALVNASGGRFHLCKDIRELPPPVAPYGESIVLKDSSSLAQLRQALTVVGTKIGFADMPLFELISAAQETAMNAVVHGCGGEATLFAGHRNGRPLVQVWVKDQGDGLNSEILLRCVLEAGFSTLTGGFGHGFTIICETAHRVYLCTGSTGTTVVIEVELNADQSGLPRS